ncbi:MULTISPECIES: DNA cytosine methyltransferase [Actinomycetes]|uniref:DNA cytosine methyltransferase n=1 Tax=Actinomycetes TaxID=1760 RepID=UPI000685E60B|nr:MULTISPECIES: DNA cytosine methyltransferase [Actinomycetes]
MHDTAASPAHPRIGSLFSGYGGLDLAVEHATGGQTVWFSELNTAVAGVFAHHWPDAPNLGDISTIDWATVPPVDVLCGGFPCQDISTVGKGAGLAPGTRSGLWSYMATAIEVLQPRLVVIENAGGLLSATATRPETKGQRHDDRNPDDATPGPASAIRDLESEPWMLGDDAARPLRALGAVLGDLADLGMDARWIGLPASLAGAPHHRFRIFNTAYRQDPVPDASGLGLLARWRDAGSGAGGRRGTIVLSHQVIDLALHGPAGSPDRGGESETLFALVESIFVAGAIRRRDRPMGTHHRTPRPCARDPERRWRI